MIALSFIGIFWMFGGMALFHYADDERQQDISAGFIGIGFGLVLLVRA